MTLISAHLSFRKCTTLLATKLKSMITVYNVDLPFCIPPSLALSLKKRLTSEIGTSRRWKMPAARAAVRVSLKLLKMSYCTR